MNRPKSISHEGTSSRIHKCTTGFVDKLSNVVYIQSFECTDT